jgi:hypothetical protein
VPRIASVNLFGAVIRSADGFTFIEHALVEVFDAASVARIVNSDVPTSVAAPAIAPVCDPNDNPAGSDPEAIAHAIGASPPTNESDDE